MHFFAFICMAIIISPKGNQIIPTSFVPKKFILTVTVLLCYLQVLINCLIICSNFLKKEPN